APNARVKRIGSASPVSPAVCDPSDSVSPAPPPTSPHATTQTAKPARTTRLSIALMSDPPTSPLLGYREWRGLATQISADAHHGPVGRALRRLRGLRDAARVRRAKTLRRPASRG